MLQNNRMRWIHNGNNVEKTVHLEKKIPWNLFGCRYFIDKFNLVFGLCHNWSIFPFVFAKSNGHWQLEIVHCSAIFSIRFTIPIWYQQTKKKRSQKSYRTEIPEKWWLPFWWMFVSIVVAACFVYMFGEWLCRKIHLMPCKTRVAYENTKLYNGNCCWLSHTNRMYICVWECGDGAFAHNHHHSMPPLKYSTDERAQASLKIRG